MKRIFRTALLVLLIASLFCTVAYAEDNGIQSVTVQNGVTLTPQLADKTAVTPITVDEVVYYPGSERMDLACSAGIVADAEYVVMVLKGAEATPSTESIVYIDQLKASGSSVTFNLYPLALAVDTEYHVYLASNAEGSEGLVEVASFLFGAPVDKTELQAAITAAQALTKTDYTAESWAAMQTALTAANEVFENADATQAEVDAAKTALNEAVAALVVDKAALQTAITAADALVEADYTSDSWTAMQTALTSAKAVLAKEDATPAEVSAAVTALNSAVDALVVDKAALQTAITAADALVEADYTADSWTAMQTALTSAKAVLAKEDATPAEVSAATTALNEAVAALVPVAPAVDKTALQAAITAAEALTETDYTAESWSAMQTALSSAKTVLAKEDATQAEVDAATTALNDAVTALVPAPVIDKTALQAAITAAEALTETDYTAESWSAMQTALSSAKAVLAKADATQAEVDTATTTLNDAVTALVPATPAEVDKSQLEAAIAYAEGLTASDYTADSWAAVQTALSSAKTVMAKTDATQDEVDAAQIALDNAVAALVPKGDEPFQFTDVRDPSKYYYNPVYWAADNGITKGYSDGSFGVGRDCTRREILTFLWRFAGQPTGYGDARTMFNDMGKYAPSSAANKAVAWAYSEGIVKGYADGGIHPDASIIRKDVMIMLYRLAGKPAVSGTLTFTDCQSLNKNSDTYKAILWGSKNKITNGYSSGPYKGQFGCSLNCLREQIVTFLYRYNNL